MFRQLKARTWLGWADCVCPSLRQVHSRSSDADKCRIRVRNCELVHSPGFDLWSRFANDLALEDHCQFIDVRTIIIEREGISAGNQPTILHFSQMQPAAVHIAHNAVGGGAGGGGAAI